MNYLIIFGFIVLVLALVFFALLCYKAREEVKYYRTIPPVDSNLSHYRCYYALRDEVSKEMLFSPFYAKNNACAIRQVQEVIKNPQLFPKSLHSKDVSLYYVFTINEKSLAIVENNDIDFTPVMKISSCDEDSLKLAYEKFKEVK